MALGLDFIRTKIGSPKRSKGWFKPSPLAFPEPPWLEKQDQVGLAHQAIDAIWKHGVVVWGAVVRANRLLFDEGTEDYPGLVIFATVVPDDQALAILPELNRRLGELGDESFPNPGWTRRETEWWEDLNDDMSFHKNFALPPEWQEPGAAFKGSSVIFHRGHLPGGRIGSRILPLLVDPVTGFTQMIPCSYWPDGLAEELAEQYAFRVSDETSSPEADRLEFLEPELLDQESRERIYKGVFGPIASVFHEIAPGPHIDVYCFEWPGPRDEHGYVTGGMSDARQPGGGEFGRIELVFYSKFHDERFAGLLRNFARYPWETGQPIGPWHIVSLGNFAAAAVGSARFPALMFFPGVAKPESPVHQAEKIARLGIRFLTVVPITQGELDFSHSDGIGALVARFGAARFDLAFDPERPSLV